ncbi:MAG TPA: hypothetical protein VF190_06920, partial [Rhodothermales bacterium]
ARDVLIEAIGRAAAAWSDPEHPARAAAVDRTLDLDNRFTLEAITFAINQQMDATQPEALESWLDGRTSPRPRTVGVLNAGNVPFVELQDFLAVVLLRHTYRGVLSSRSPHLLPAFVEEIRSNGGAMDVAFRTVDEVFAEAEAIIATGTDETRDRVAALCDEAGILEPNRLLRGNRYAVAVMTGSETEDDLEFLAEDALLHEGLGCRNVAIVCAPSGTSPDPLLEAFANFRGVFPAHPSTPGTLTMPKAFLEAVGNPHAFGEGLEFLLSKGEPEVQQPAHVRWSEYESLDEVNSWLRTHAEEIQLVVGREEILAQLPESLPREALGRAQRPAISWCADGRDVIDFLVSLAD